MRTLIVLSAFDIMHRHNIGLDVLRNAFPKQLAGCLPKELENLEKRLRYQGSYEGAHERMKIKVLSLLAGSCCESVTSHVRRFFNTVDVQMQEIDRESSSLIPEEFDYSKLQGLSVECLEKLDRARPLNLAAASRFFAPCLMAVNSFQRAAI